MKGVEKKVNNRERSKKEKKKKKGSKDKQVNKFLIRRSSLLNDLIFF